jgi:uncharacterized protein (DUF697 family)
MASPASDVARALIDALPQLDHKRIVEDSRRQVGIVIIGDEQPAQQLLEIMHSDQVPQDVRLVLWRHDAGSAAPLPANKTELAIVVPATEPTVRAARQAFSGVPLLGVQLSEAPTSQEVFALVRLPSLDADAVRTLLIPPLVDRLWERRLALGRGMPIARDRISRLLIARAVKDVKVLLGSVAGAAGGRNGVPTPATAQLLVHQAALIVRLGAVYGLDIEDKVALIQRVVPHLSPTLLLDVAESQVSRLARLAGKDERHRQLYGTAAAVVTRPALSASSTLLAGFAARRVFRGAVEGPPLAARVAQRARSLSRRTMEGAGRGVMTLAGAVVQRRRPTVSGEVATSGEDDEASRDASGY